MCTDLGACQCEHFETPPVRIAPLSDPKRTLFAPFRPFPAQNPENLLIFAAGNDGDETGRSSCTMSSPAIAKNVLAVGATTSGSSRISMTGALYPDSDYTDINTVAYFSSYGPTEDGRIKPEVMAPGDMVRRLHSERLLVRGLGSGGEPAALTRVFHLSYVLLRRFPA